MWFAQGEFKLSAETQIVSLHACCVYVCVCLPVSVCLCVSAVQGNGACEHVLYI